MSKATQFLMTGKMVRDLCAGSPRERLLHRAHCVVLVLYGLSASEVARIFGDSPRAVAYWVKQFQNDGMKGLGEDSRPGRPSKLTTEQKRRLEAFIKRSRAKSKGVNAEALSRFILHEYGVILTIRQCLRILRRIGQ
jgi:transposase